MDYAKHYRALIERARDRRLQDRFIERHHVIPKCMGGGDEPSNLVPLTPEEHCLAHLLLAKMHPDHEKVVFAAMDMAGRGSIMPGPKNKRYGKKRRASVNSWSEKQKKKAVFRFFRRKAKRYRPEDVARLTRILAPGHFPT